MIYKKENSHLEIISQTIASQKNNSLDEDYLMKLSIVFFLRLLEENWITVYWPNENYLQLNLDVEIEWFI